MLQTDIVANMISCTEKGYISVTPITRKEMYKQPTEGHDMSKHTDVLEKEREHILQVCAMYHIRNGIEQHDGSRGVIQITHEQLKSELANMFIRGLNA